MRATDLIGLGDDPALELLNTTAQQGGVTLELLGSGADYLQWLEAAGMIDEADRDAISARFTSAELDGVAIEAVRLREQLRSAVRAWSDAGSQRIPADVSYRLNELLRSDSWFRELVDDSSGSPSLVERRRWTDARQLLAAPAQAAAVLFTAGDRSLVRQCEGCTMWFYDHTKAHRRRWCSMALCGNRAKVRALRERRR